MGLDARGHDHVEDPGVGQASDLGVLLHEIEVLGEGPLPFQFPFFGTIFGKTIHYAHERFTPFFERSDGSPARLPTSPGTAATSPRIPLPPRRSAVSASAAIGLTHRH